MIEWNKPDERFYQHGVDRGVLYPVGSDPVAWNGLTGVDEAGNGSTSINYIDGKIYLADSDATDFSGKLTAFFFPDAFAACIGMPQVADGLVLDNQKPKRFGLSYRSLIGSGTTGDMFGYEIHLLYNVMATIDGVSRKTLNDSPAPLEFSFGLVATPVKLAGFRPTAHYIIDTRNLDPETIAEIESILYGSLDGLTPGRLPAPAELFDMLNFGTAITVTSYVADGTYNVKGAKSNVYLTGDGTTYQIDNIYAIDNGDGTYTIATSPVGMGDTLVTEV